MNGCEETPDRRIDEKGLGPGSVSVIMPVRNEERYIKDCLATVRSQDYADGELEFLVADGRSDDGTRTVVERVAEEDPRVRLIDNPGRIVPTGMNAAILAARGEYVVRVDGHATIPRDYVSSIMRAFRESGAECVGGKMVARGAGHWGQVISRVTSHPFGVGGARFHYSDTPADVDTVYLGAYRRETLIDIGSYDERFVRNQDDELNYRLRSRGGRVWYDPRIHASYVNRSTLTKLFSQYRQYGFWKVWMYRKHAALFRARHAVPAMFVLACLAATVLVFFRPQVGLVMLASVLLLHTAVGVAAATRSRWPAELVASAPLAFLTLHLSYGVGFLQGLFSLVVRRGKIPQNPRSAEGGMLGVEQQ